MRKAKLFTLLDFLSPEHLALTLTNEYKSPGLACRIALRTLPLYRLPLPSISIGSSLVGSSLADNTSLTASSLMGSSFAPARATLGTMVEGSILAELT